MAIASKAPRVVRIFTFAKVPARIGAEAVLRAQNISRDGSHSGETGKDHSGERCLRGGLQVCVSQG